MVVTVTVAVPLPLANIFGLTAQVVWVAAIGSEQDRLTCEANPFCDVTEMALVNVAGWPALTVCVVGPEEVMEKSGGGGGGETVKLKGADVPAGGGSMTYKG